MTLNLVLGAVTCAGKLSLLIEFAEHTAAIKVMKEIRVSTLEFLLEPCEQTNTPGV